MNTLAPFVIAYLLGLATPFMVYRGLIRPGEREGGDGCMLNMILAAIGLLMFATLIFWFRGSYF